MDHGPFEPFVFYVCKCICFRAQMDHGPFEPFLKDLFGLCALMDHGPFELGALIF